MAKKLRISYLLYLFFIVSTHSFGQSYKWVSSTGSFLADRTYGSTTDTVGNVYITGYSRYGGITIGDSTFPRTGTLVAKYDTTGAVKMVRLFGNDDTYVVDIAVDSKGNIYATGNYSYSFVIDGYMVPYANQIRGYVVKFDPKGRLVWFKDFGSDMEYGIVFSNSIGIDKLDNIYVGGTYKYNIAIENEKIVPVEDYDMFLISMDRDSRLRWMKSAGGRREDYLFDIAVGKEGVYLAGSAELHDISFDGYVYSVNRNRSAFVAKYHFDGKFGWVNSDYVNYISEAIGIAVNDKEEIVIAGNAVFDNTFQSHNKFINKYDRKGMKIFDRLINDQLDNGFYLDPSVGRKKLDIKTSGNDIYFATCSYSKYNIDYLEYSSSTLDNLVVKFNEIGYPQWLKISGGDESDYGRSLATYKNIVYVGGDYSSLKASFDGHEIANNSGNGDTDFFISMLYDNASNKCPEGAYKLSYSSDHFCSADSIKLAIDSKYAVYVNWYKGTEIIQSGYSNSIYVREPGSYWAHINSLTRCSAYSDTVNIATEENFSSNDEIKILPSPVVAVVGKENSCSEMETYKTVADNRYKYQWKATLAEYMTPPTNDSIVIRWTNNGSARVMVTVTDLISGCVVVDSIIVNIERISKPDISQRGVNITTNSIGTYQWFLNNKPIENNKGGNDQSLFPDQEGYYKVMVSSQNSCSFTSDSIYNAGPTGMENSFRERIYLSPNPTKSLTKINNFKGKISKDNIMVFDVTGKKVKSKFQDNELDISECGMGVYFIHLLLPSENLIFKVIKE